MQPAPTMLRLRIRRNERMAVLAYLCLTVLGIRLPNGPHLWAEEPKTQHTLRGHTGAVLFVAFSSDGKTLASASDDKTIKLWDSATGQERATLKGHTDHVYSVAFSPDGKTLASGSRDKTIKLWTVATGEQQGMLQGHAASVRSVAFSPDGKTLASGSLDDTVVLWNLNSEKRVDTLRGRSATSVAFSPDGKTIASANGICFASSEKDRQIRLWDVATGEQRCVLQGHTGKVMSVAFSPDGKTLASASSDKTVKLWESATGQERATLQGHTDYVYSVAFSPDGKTLASAGQDHSVKLWDIPTGKVRVTLEGHADFVWFVAFNPDGKTLASASYDKTIRLWDVSAAPKAVSIGAVAGATADLEGLWTTLAGEDAAEAYQAIGTLVAAPEQAISLGKKRLRPATKLCLQDLARWITDLDHEQFVVREKATEKLEKMGEQILPALRRKLADKPSPEVCQRIEQLASKFEGLTPDSMRTVRVIEVLESIGTSEAKEVLETLAAGAEAARLTEEAKASLVRLSKRVVAEK